jgi:hypothetical protein
MSDSMFDYKTYGIEFRIDYYDSIYGFDTLAYIFKAGLHYFCVLYTFPYADIGAKNDESYKNAMDIYEEWHSFLHKEFGGLEIIESDEPITEEDDMLSVAFDRHLEIRDAIYEHFSWEPVDMDDDDDQPMV